VTELLLIRHGQSEFNAERRWAGWEHRSPLTGQGEAEAQALADDLASESDIEWVYTSPLLRARQTAQIIGKALGLTPLELAELREVNVGHVGGLTTEEFGANYPEDFARWQDRTDIGFTWPGGENRCGFFRRTARAMDHIVSMHPDDKVVVVCHGGVIRAALAHYLPDDYGEWWTYPLHTGSLTRLLVTPDCSQLLVLNQYDSPLDSTG
jgi:broad specificity phosphatase PhoE